MAPCSLLGGFLSRVAQNRPSQNRAVRSPGWPVRRLVLRFVFRFALLTSLGVTQALGQSSLPDLQSAGALGAGLFSQSGTTGMVLVVVRNDEVFFRGYGETAPGSGQLPTADSLLRLCSLTKIFTTDLLVKLVNDKTVNLDDHLQRFAPPHTVAPERIRPITLVDLATHTAGLPREIGNAPPGTPHFTFPDYRTRWRWLPSQHLRSTPGRAALYSNVGFDFLSDALESAARRPYATLLAERTLNPLNLRQTTFFPNPAQCARLLMSADKSPCTITENTRGSSGLYSTPTDMTVWLKYLLGVGGPAIPAQNPASQAVYIVPSTLVSEKGLDHAGTPTGIGLGWIHLLPPGDPSRIIQKTGGGGGFTTYIAINQPRHIAIFIAATDGPAGYRFNLFKGADNVLLALADLPPIPPEPPKRASKRANRRVPRHSARRPAHPAGG
jgi:D-alanyl-D-alanine-carboxypeptidase/D-alanyl-D-alanine-endopeptidase